MKIILLRPSGETQVDDDDHEFLRHFSWWRNKTTGYASRNIPGPGTNRATLYIHRFIMEPCEPFFVDHINGDKLDNRKSNLRLVMPQENAWNRRYKKAKKHSKYRGVTLYVKENAWGAKIRAGGHSMSLGRYDTEIEAAAAYDLAVLKYYPETPWLNFPKGLPIPPPIRRRLQHRVIKETFVYPLNPDLRASIKIRGGTEEDRHRMMKDLDAAWRQYLGA